METVVEAERILRLFFAFWPPAGLAARLHGLALDMRGRVMNRDGLHVTAAFLGPQLSSRLPALREVAQRCPMPAETLRFDHLQHWSRQLVVAVPSEVPTALKNGVMRLHAELLALDIRVEPHGWMPHITLLRKAPAQPLPDFEPFEWPPDALHLAASDGRGHYASLHRWPTT